MYAEARTTEQPATAISGAAAPADTQASDLPRKRRLFRAFEENKRREQEEQREARRYYNGRQWTDSELTTLARRNQPAIFDNRIGRKVDFLVGVEQRMRRDPKGYGRTPKDQKSADVATASVRFVCDQQRWENIASSAAHDGLVSGVGVAWIGAGKGREGTDVKLKLGQVDRWFYDPRSTMPDFSDARYMGMHLWLDIDDVKAEYPQHSDDLDDLMDRDNGLTITGMEEDRQEQWADFEQRRVRIIEMYERKALPGSITGWGWWYCKFTGSIALDSRWSPYVDINGIPECPYEAWSPYVDERGDRYGVVRNMKPMQDEVNHRRSKLLHRINVNRLHMRDGLVEDVDKTRSEMAKPDGVVLHQGTWNQDIGVIDQTFEAKGEADLLAQAQSSLENLGPNPGLIGKGGGIADQSGRAILAQRDSGMTELSPVFERLRDWKLRCYRKMWGRIRQTWQGQRYIRITDDPRAPQYLGINSYSLDPMTGQPMAENVVAEIDVDIILEEGPDTIVMQEELMQTLSQLGDAAMGPIGRVMIELSQVANKDQLLQMMDKVSAPNPEVTALQQRMAELEGALKQANIAKLHADTENKRADTTLKLSQIAVPPQMMGQLYPVPFGDAGMPQGAPPPQQIMPPAPPPGGPQMPPPGMPMGQDAPIDQMPGGLPIQPEMQPNG